MPPRSLFRYPTRALREQASNLPSNVFLVSCRKSGSLGEFSYREFEINPEPGEGMIFAFYRHHGQEWECGRSYEWIHLHKRQMREAWQFFMQHD